MQKITTTEMLSFMHIRSLIPKRKKLLVLDFDQTLADFTPRDEYVPLFKKRRPHLKSFLADACQFYNIVIWSATSITKLLNKLNELQMLEYQPYSIWFCLDVTRMQWAKATIGKVAVKPLSVIWEMYPDYNHKNTLMVDDKARNFLNNPRNGLRIEPYYIEDTETDEELMHLKKYVQNLARHCSDFSKVDHSAWKEYNPKH